MTIPQTGGYVLGSTEGEGYWFLGAHLMLKVTGAQSTSLKERSNCKSATTFTGSPEGCLRSGRAASSTTSS